MDGVHDLGGMDGYGPIHVEADEARFHHAWEGRVYALNTAMGARGIWNIDIGRFGIESLPPRKYVTSSYYELWLAKLEVLLAKYSAALGDGPTFATADVPRVLARGSYVRAPAAAARYAVGDHVRTRNIHPKSHTRLPRYVRGHVGTIVRVHAPNVFPDSVVRGDGEDPQWLYTVAFDGRELWGEDAEAGTEVSVEAFEPYLEPA
jgi:nitrile hydratase